MDFNTKIVRLKRKSPSPPHLGKNLLEQEYQKPQIISESDDIGKLMQILEAFKLLIDLDIDHLKLGRKVVPENCVIYKDNKKLYFFTF